MMLSLVKTETKKGFYFLHESIFIFLVLDRAGKVLVADFPRIRIPTQQGAKQNTYQKLWEFLLLQCFYWKT